MMQNEFRPAPGAHKRSKRVGRGDASGHGSYSGKGMKGQKARSGLDIKPKFEGGQTPLSKRLPKMRGFNNKFRTEYSIVNVEQLSLFAEGAEVNPDSMLASGLVHSVSLPVKILGEGEVNCALTVKAHKFSASAKQKIEAAGGKTEEIAGKSRK